MTDETNDIIYRLRKRAEIRRQIKDRKSVQEGQPDRMADLLEEAADRIEKLEQPSQQKQMVADDFEIFVDYSYYDMWCLKPTDSRSFDATLHFVRKNDAVHALHTILEWYK